ncbi:polyprenyl diphosphate synthase [Streptomyces sp. NPDC006510]|uniref:polyprenyl diphosphate synthase n=1 Tax=Streptomyces sp. NPDC006510 TaxID=3155600 RepID=UPI0033AAFE31
MAQTLNRTAEAPRHVALIADGNRRWAKGHHVPVVEGFREGARRVHDALAWCDELGAEIVTIFLLSERNLQRPSDELLPLLDVIRELVVSLQENSDWNTRAIGEIDTLPTELANVLIPASGPLPGEARKVVNLAIAYNGHKEIIRAVGNALRESSNPTYSAAEIGAEEVSRHLSSTEAPPPDLIIRTSGERRLSGFLLWQASDTHLHFRETLWPDFQRSDLLAAFAEYQSQNRTLGL